MPSRNMVYGRSESDSPHFYRLLSKDHKERVSLLQKKTIIDALKIPTLKTRKKCNKFYGSKKV
jgi:hypothetical protein